ncbi:MAG: 2-hydroxychromene-2-carboxylate isomerase [Rhodobacteraceae bacterium]|nr:2-hydroxychromene-2-carboxylate isomerase [Paracoccaceae bacterium]
MAARLTFWFEFASTYSYLSAMRIADAATAAGVRVIWRPFLLGPIFAAQGWPDSPFNIYPAKGRYMWRDLARRSALYGVPFRQPETFPQNGVLAARVAQLALFRPQGPAFVRAVYGAQFADGADIAERTTIAACLDRAGLPQHFLDDAGSPDNKAALRRATETAMQMGLFGAPSFTVDGELFWGDDRLEDALRHAFRQTRTAGA